MFNTGKSTHTAYAQLMPLLAPTWLVAPHREKQEISHPWTTENLPEESQERSERSLQKSAGSPSTCQLG